MRDATPERTLRALALDIDGTLIGADKRVPPFTRSEVARVAEEFGAEVFVVTARPPASARLVAAQLGVHASIASFSGALVEPRAGEASGDGAGGSPQTLRAVPIARPVVIEALAAATGLPLHLGLYGRETWTVSDLGHWGLREARNTAVWPSASGAEAIDHAVTDQELFKVMFRGESEPLIDLEQRLRPLAGEVAIHRSGQVLEFTAAAARKFSAVELLCRHFGLSTSEVISFGDTDADREMLESTGVGILMGNAGDGVAEGVERTLMNTEDGVGMMLRRFFPTERVFDPWGTQLPTV